MPALRRLMLSSLKADSAKEAASTRGFFALRISMDRDLLYFSLSLAWLAMVAAGFAFVLLH